MQELAQRQNVKYANSKLETNFGGRLTNYTLAIDLSVTNGAGDDCRLYGLIIRIIIHENISERFVR